MLSREAGGHAQIVLDRVSGVYNGLCVLMYTAFPFMPLHSGWRPLASDLLLSPTSYSLLALLLLVALSSYRDAGRRWKWHYRFHYCASSSSQYRTRRRSPKFSSAKMVVLSLRISWANSVPFESVGRMEGRELLETGTDVRNNKGALLPLIFSESHPKRSGSLCHSPLPFAASNRPPPAVVAAICYRPIVCHWNYRN